MLPSDPESQCIELAEQQAAAAGVLLEVLYSDGRVEHFVLEVPLSSWLWTKVWAFFSKWKTLNLRWGRRKMDCCLLSVDACGLGKIN